MRIPYMVVDRRRMIKLYEKAQYVNTVKKNRDKTQQITRQKTKEFCLCTNLFKNFKYGNQLDLSKVTYYVMLFSSF